VTPRNPSSPWEQSPRTAALPRSSALAIKLFPPPQHFLHCGRREPDFPPSTHSSIKPHIRGFSHSTSVALHSSPSPSNLSSPRDDLQQPWPNPSGISARTRPRPREFPSLNPVVSIWHRFVTTCADFFPFSTPQNTPATTAPISSHAQQPGVASIKEGELTPLLPNVPRDNALC